MQFAEERKILVNLVRKRKNPSLMFQGNDFNELFAFYTLISMTDCEIYFEIF